MTALTPAAEDSPLPVNHPRPSSVLLAGSGAARRTEIDVGGRTGRDSGLHRRRRASRPGPLT
ncbi:hypothetical protein, partial [Micromonospora globispora]